jgi:hypothetical protein
MKTLALLPLLALCGCMALSVPRTEIEGSLGGQPFRLATPKDSKLKELMIEVRNLDAFGGTNFTSICIGSLEANMSPEVITTTSAGQVQMINAVADQIKAAGAVAK